ncbi:unnamed protein product, partial [Symbiodinium necroappetens]
DPMPAVQELREDICDAMHSWTDSLPQARFNEVTQSLAWEMREDPAWVETYGDHFSWHVYWSWAKKPGTYGTFANISSFCRLRSISVDVYAQRADRKICIWQERASADGPEAGPIPIRLLWTGNHFDLL